MPLNGSKIHPLSDFAIGVLKMIKRKPMPAQEVNAGVVHRLTDENLVELKPGPSPYKKHSKFIKVQFLHITDAGEQRLKELA